MMPVRLAGVLLVSALKLATTVNGYPAMIDADIDALQQGLSSNQFTSVDLVKTYLGRIKDVNKYLHPVIVANPDALAIASHLDLRRKQGVILGPLHGIPVLIKDTIATEGLRMGTTAGSYALMEADVLEDSTIAVLLRLAGAIILGKTNLSEWGDFRSLNISNGWSPVGGQTYGAYYPEQDPSSSSSGSAVAASLGLATVTLGGETIGSIIDPASFNNVVGIKPTVGLTSRYLVVPISERMDTVGPITKTVKDAAYVLQAIAFPDPHDNYTHNAARPPPDFVAACDRKALGHARIGVPRNVITLMRRADSGPMLDAFEKSLDVLRRAGATVVDADFPAAAEYLYNPHLINQVMRGDFAVNIASYLRHLARNPHNITSLADLRNFTRHFAREGYPEHGGTEIWDGALAQGFNNTDPRFWKVYQDCLRIGGEDGLLGTLKKHKLDAIVLPSPFSWDWAAAVGAPIVSVPMGAYPANQPVVKTSRGLVKTGPNIPFGLAFMGANWHDDKLIGFAYAFEQRTEARERIKPYIAPRTEIADVLLDNDEDYGPVRWEL